MVKPGYTCLGLEYFVNVGDRLWEMDDDDLVKLGAVESSRTSASSTPMWSRPATSCACRRPTRSTTAPTRRTSTSCASWLERHTTNVYPVGRNGMHKYNNQDHSMFTAMLSVENILGAYHDIWSVNVEQEYHEEGSSRSAGSHAVRHRTIGASHRMTR